MKEKNPFKIVTGKHKVSYVHVKEPSGFENGEKKYGCTFLIQKDHPDVQRIKGVIKAAYQANKESMFKGVPLTSAKLWNPLRDGDEWMEEHPSAEEYKSCYFLKASTTKQPVIFDTDKQEIFDYDEVYSGCFCRGVIVCYPFNNKSKGFGFYLNSLMKMEDGPRLGGFDVSADDYDDDYDDLL
jgi:hypothetical protein